MTSDEVETIDSLTAQAEALLRGGASRGEVYAVLERILTLAPDGSDAHRFAHRQLAELRIEEAPWIAALHLRKALVVDPDDDVAHALMGLCQALLGNFRAAVAAYRRALALSPRNPWYHHNLGHLLDVALSSPRAALPHLRSAHRTEPLEDEITASLSHCLAMCGSLDEAKALADEAVRGAPRNKDHRALLVWIERGAPQGVGPHVAMVGGRRAAPPGTVPSAPRKKRKSDVNDGIAVLKLLERHMREAGFSARQLEVARTLFHDYLDMDGVYVTKPEVFAAAVEYAVTRVHRMNGTSQREIAKRYGCAPNSVGLHFSRMEKVLDLVDGDPRYG